MSPKRENQSKWGSLFESICAAAIAAPSSNIIHWYMLDIWGNDLSNLELKAHYMWVSWLSFFIHSFVWKFILRRTFERYPSLEPRNIYLKIKEKQ